MHYFVMYVHEENKNPLMCMFGTKVEALPHVNDHMKIWGKTAKSMEDWPEHGTYQMRLSDERFGYAGIVFGIAY